MIIRHPKKQLKCCSCDYQDRDATNRSDRERERERERERVSEREREGQLVSVGVPGGRSRIPGLT